MIFFGALATIGLICLGIGLLLALHEERKMGRVREEAWEKERQGLLNRIQAPLAAPFMNEETTEIPAYVPFDDDDAFHDAVEEAGRVEG